MEGAIACAGASSLWRPCLCLKENSHLSRFRGEAGGRLQYLAAVKPQTKAKAKKWQNGRVSRNPKAVSGHSFRCIFQSASTSFPASPEDDEIYESSDAADVNVKFVLQRECNFGQQFNVIGEDPLLGAWDPSAAVPLQWSDNHVWSTELKVPGGKSYEYKFLLSGQNGEIEWQPGPNRIFKVSSEASSPLVVMELWDLGSSLVSQLLSDSNIVGGVTKVKVQGAELEFIEQENSGKEPGFKTETAVSIKQVFKTQSDASIDEIHEEVSPAKSDVICDVAEAGSLSSAGSSTDLISQGSPSELERGLPREMEEASFVSRGPSREFEVKAEHNLEAKTTADDDHGLNLEEASVEHLVEDVNDAEFSTTTNVLEAATRNVAFAGSMVAAVAEEPPIKIDEASVPIQNFSRKYEVENVGGLRTKKTAASDCGVTIEEISIGLVAMASPSLAGSMADPSSVLPPLKIKGKSSPKGISREYKVDVKDEDEAEKEAETEMDVDDGMKREIETSVKHLSQEVSDAKSGVISCVAASGASSVFFESSVLDWGKYSFPTDLVAEKSNSKMNKASFVNERLSEDSEANTKNSKENGHFPPLENADVSASELPLVNVALVAALAEVSAKLLKDQKLLAVNDGRPS